MPVIALLTDFGTKDYFVGAMKGMILSHAPDVTIVDITHEIEPQNITSASFALRACYRNFPPGTIFVCVVDPGVGSNRRSIVVEKESYLFLAPDNGLLGFLLSGEPAAVFELTNRDFFASEVSSTFHGRDIFAPAAAHLSKGVSPLECGPPIADAVSVDIESTRHVAPDELEAEVLAIDRFGNLITNLRPNELPRKFTIEVAGRRIEDLRNYFGEGPEGELFMIFGSAGFLEIAAFQASAKDILQIEAGRKMLVKLLP